MAMIVINFKNYVFGEKALDLARKIQKYLPKAIVAVPAVDIRTISDKTKLTVYAQHVDSPSSPTRSTGYVTASVIKKIGAKGSLLNHSEHKLISVQAPLNDLQENRLKSIVCVSTLKDAKSLSKLRPYAMAFEDPELIATNKSITKYKSKDIKKFVDLLKGTGIIPLCGAGVNSVEDVREAYWLGCKGVLVASAIAASKKPEKILKDMKNA